EKERIDSVAAVDVTNEAWLISVADDGGYFTVVNAAHPLSDVMNAGLGMAFNAQANIDGSAVVTPSLARFDGARELGQVASPGVVFPLVLVEARMLRTAARHAPADEQVALFQVAARFAEFAGWMAQEAGDDRIAWWLTRKAVTMADAAGDFSLRSY